MRHQSLKSRLTASLHRKVFPVLKQEVVELCDEVNCAPSPNQTGTTTKSIYTTETNKTLEAANHTIKIEQLPSIDTVEEFPILKTTTTETNNTNFTCLINNFPQTSPLGEGVKSLNSLAQYGAHTTRPPPSRLNDQRTAAFKIVQKLPHARIIGLELLGVGGQISSKSCCNHDPLAAKSQQGPPYANHNTPYSRITPDTPADEDTLISSLNASVAEEKLSQRRGKPLRSCLKVGRASGAQVKKSVCFRGNRSDQGSEVTTILIYQATHVPLPWPAMPIPLNSKKGERTNIQGLLRANHNNRISTHPHIGVDFFSVKLMS